MRGISGEAGFSDAHLFAIASVDATQLIGHAQATVRYGDFNLAIPNVPSVTGVSDTTTLALAFTAKVA